MCSRQWWNPDEDAATIVDERGLRQVTDSSTIDFAVDRILAANPDKVAE